eukprot:Hpha_TRINITY_DN1971_c0_g1::TRINITY_DN1971_c0_g1_i1::g.31151::m.31151
MCCRWDWLVREGDTKEEARMRVVLFPFALVASIFASLALYMDTRTSSQFINIIGLGVCVLALLHAMAGMASNLISVGTIVDIVLLVSTVGICACDLANATRSFGFRAWALVILLLDIVLVFKRDHTAPFIVSFALVYIIAQSVESVQRFGLYELGYWGSAGVEISRCNCASPPCSDAPLDSALVCLCICFAFLSDFYLTRGFATGMRVQLRRMESSIEVSGQIAAALARYDVDEAATVIDSAEDLPEELAESYRDLLSNLRLYKDYLPDALLPDEDADCASGLHSAR